MTSGDTMPYGWRWSRVTPDGRLSSAWGHRRPYDTTTITAECAARADTTEWNCGSTATPHDDPIPGADCNCGIYYLEKARAFLEHFDGLRERTDSVRVTDAGLVFEPYDWRTDNLAMTYVEVVGRTVPMPGEFYAGHRTMRAAAVRIRAIVLQPHNSIHAETMRKHYNVPITVGTFSQSLFKKVRKAAS